MDNLPEWAVSVIAIAVGLSPGQAFLMAGPIGRDFRPRTGGFSFRATQRNDAVAVVGLPG
jgi:hypothetical protein